jgi:hypothetical protein
MIKELESQHAVTKQVQKDMQKDLRMKQKSDHPEKKFSELNFEIK